MNAFSVDSEKALGEEMEALAHNDPEKALNKALEYCDFALTHELSRSASASLARVICRFLLCKKTKSRLTQYLKENETLCKAVFGVLNTYKYSLSFLLKRIFRLNEAEFTRRVLTYLCQNPWCDPCAKPWSDRLNADFVITEALKADDDYLNLTDKNREVISGFINNNGSLQ